jgi:hypothetical protein
MKTDKYIDQASDIFCQYILARFGLSINLELEKDTETLHTVQIGAFNDLNTAKEIVKCLKILGIEAFIKSK